MWTDNNSLNDFELAALTVHNQAPRKLSNHSQNDINSSLIFGNEITSKSIQTQNDDVDDKTFNMENGSNENVTQKLTLMKETPTQNDNTFELLQDPNDTPFLAKLKDPFDDTYNESLLKLNIEIQPNKKFDAKLHDTLSLQNKLTHKYNFDTLRIEADDSCLEYETQGDETIIASNDKNRYSNDADTQIVNNISQSDTLKFAANSDQNNNSNEHNKFIFNEETKINLSKQRYTRQADTQVINGSYNDTQVIEPRSHGDENQGLTKIEENENTYASCNSQNESGNAIQIPSTIEKPFLSRPQVVNTQEEEPDGTPSNGRVDLSTKPVYSSSQRLGEEIDEVLTDDEKEKNRPHLQELYYDDSLLTHRLNHKRRLSYSEPNSFHQKMLKVSSNKDNYDKDKLITFKNMSKTPLSLKNKYHQQIASPSEIEESSPDIRRTDILGFSNKSSPSLLQTDNMTPTTDNNTTNEILSSPTKDRNRMEMETKLSGIDHTSLRNVKIVKELNSDDHSSELEDIDLEHFNEKNLSSAKNKRGIIAVNKISQSQNDLQSNSELGQVTSMNADMDDLQEDIHSCRTDKVLFEESLNILTEEHLRSSESVWVSFKFNMYTGTIAKIGHGSLVVEFEEGNYSIKNSDLYLLDIRIGDKLRTRSSKYKFVVNGLINREHGDKINCIRGYNTVLLRRISKARGKKFEESEVSLSECYMELSDWIQHQQIFQFMFEGQDILKQCGGMFLNSFNPNIRKTPTRSTRYPNTSDVADCDLKYRNDVLSSPSKKYESRIVNGGTLLKLNPNDKLFSGMLFCLTFGKSVDEDRKERIKTAIETNGGSLIDEGLQDILSYSRAENGSLALESHSLSGLRFGAVISNNFCRSAKYLQALALGWPILSDYYIFDCLKDNRKLEKWPTYLLPAGQSQFLGCVKSLDIFRFRQNYESNRELYYQLNNNNHLLQDVFIIMMDSKTNLKAIKTCEFIFHAFGSKDLKYCTSVNEVTKEVKKYKDGPIILYDNNHAIKNEFNTLKAASTAGSRTRSQTRTNNKDNSIIQQPLSTTINTKKIGFINWEWVVQCVISGCIWDPEYLLILS